MKRMLSLIFQFFIGFLSVMIVAYFLAIFAEIPGLSTARNIWIETAMTTGDHQWLATYFFPESIIDKVMAGKIEDQGEVGRTEIIIDKPTKIEIPETKPIQNIKPDIKEENNIEFEEIELEPLKIIPEKAIIGGIISEKSVKLTKTSKQMAYLTIEDLLGTVEVIVFPRDYEQNASVLEQDAKVFVQGRVSCEDDKPSRLICEKIIPFDQEKKELWIQFADKEAFSKLEVRMLNSLKAYEGDVPVVAYLAKEKQWKKYPPNKNISLSEPLVETLKQQFGEQNIKIRTLKAL